MGKHRPVIAVLSLHMDIHALAVLKELEERFPDVHGCLIPCDKIAFTEGVNWNSDNPYTSTLPTVDGSSIEVSSIDLIWWRRSQREQVLPNEKSSLPPEHIDLINRDSYAALFGILINEFKGKWLNDPFATSAAENKLTQLRIAQAAGFRVPRTLVSQDPDKIREFYDLLEGQVIVKPVRGSNKARIFTTLMNDDYFRTESSMKVCPTVYQELVPGDRHLRVQVFGEKIFAAQIKTTDLDWRANLQVPISSVEVEDSVRASLLKVLELLSLRMGIFDLKISPQGEVFWLEVNPQGQFLFIEGLAEINLLKEFANFLVEELNQ